MSRTATIYAQHAPAYAQLVAHEDYEGRLLPAIWRLHPLQGANVVEFGAGTGRLTRLLVPHAAAIYAHDGSPHMLATARQQLADVPSCTFVAADHRAMPLPARCADLVLEGWAFAQLAAWHLPDWRAVLVPAMREMLRVLRPGGTAILIETLGTGALEPAPPADWFEAVYAWFEGEYGFTRSWIRTDFRFATRQEAEAGIRFFFGDEQAAAIMAAAWTARDGATIVPECTGIWSRRV